MRKRKTTTPEVGASKRRRSGRRGPNARDTTASLFHRRRRILFFSSPQYIRIEGREEHRPRVVSAGRDVTLRKQHKKHDDDTPEDGSESTKQNGTGRAEDRHATKETGRKRKRERHEKRRIRERRMNDVVLTRDGRHCGEDENKMKEGGRD